MVLPITNAKKEIQGILHLHDVLGKGDFRFNGDTNC
jgi:arabinose-5-phosphate isomerase